MSPLSSFLVNLVIQKGSDPLEPENRLKIGQFEEGYEIYDLMIKLDKEKGLKRLMEEIKHYLNLINK